MRILDLAKTAVEISNPDTADLSAGLPDGSRMSAGDFNLALKTWDEPRVRFMAGQGFAHWVYFTSAAPLEASWGLDHVVSRGPGAAYVVNRGPANELISFLRTAGDLDTPITDYYDFNTKMISGELYDGTWMTPFWDGTDEGMIQTQDSLTTLSDDLVELSSNLPGVKMPCPVRGSLGYLYVKYDDANPGQEGYYFFTAPEPGVDEQKLALLCETDGELIDGSFAYVRNIGMYFGLWDGVSATLAFSSRGYKVGFTPAPTWLGRPQLQAFRDKLLIFVRTAPSGPSTNTYSLIEASNRDPSSWRVIRTFDQSTADSPLHTCELVRNNRDDICCVIHDGVLYWTVDLENWESMTIYSRVKEYASKISGSRMLLMPLNDGALSDLNIWVSGVIGDVP